MPCVHARHVASVRPLTGDDQDLRRPRSEPESSHAPLPWWHEDRDVRASRGPRSARAGCVRKPRAPRCRCSGENYSRQHPSAVASAGSTQSTWTIGPRTQRCGDAAGRVPCVNPSSAAPDPPRVSGRRARRCDSQSSCGSCMESSAVSSALAPAWHTAVEGAVGDVEVHAGDRPTPREGRPIGRVR